jgi:hypothetical protein
VAGSAEYAVLKANVATGEWTKVAAVQALEYLIPKTQIEQGARNVYAVAVQLGERAYGPRSLGVLIEQPTPIVVGSKDLPCSETFITLPLLGATVQGGSNLTVSYSELPVRMKSPMGSRIVTVRVEYESNAKLFEDPTNIFSKCRRSRPL